MAHMAVDHEPREHHRLVSRLVDADLGAIAARACARAGIDGRDEQVAYCLIVLASKPDPPRRSPDGTVKRTYCLDPEDDGFRDRLSEWADTVARNLRDWGGTYEAIHDDADRYQIGTLRRLIRSRQGNDVIDVLADGLVAVLAHGPRLEEMSIEHARELEPSPAQYAFQTPLPQWVRTAARRRSPRDTDELDARAEQQRVADVLDDLDSAAHVADEGERAWIEAVAALAETRGLLADRIERVDAFELDLARRQGASPDVAAAFVRIRAELARVADELREERRALTPMLAYVVLAMRSATQLMHVTVLSLRMESIDQSAIDAMSATMLAILADEYQPTPALIRKTRSATEAGVSRSRAKALDELRDVGARRPVILAPVARLLGAQPPVVADVGAIAAATGSRPNIVRQNRHAAGTELGMVDPWFARVFRRYAMGMT
jgi:hypothetical protein